MKKERKVNKLVESRRILRSKVLPTVRKLVEEYGFAPVNGAINVLVIERRALAEVKKAEAKLAEARAKIK